MNLKRIIYITLLIIIGWSCSQDREELVRNRMQYYDTQIIAMNANSISRIYAEDGKMLDPNGKVIKQGRKAIKDFLETFQNMKVLHNKSVSDKIEIKGDSALQTGVYSQVAVVDRDTFNISGKFIARWVWDKDGELLLKELQTIPYIK